MNYPNGKKMNMINNKSGPKMNHSFSNRGMSLEDDINVTNQFYLDTKRAVIHKKPTPVQIVKVNYPNRSAAVITEAYFKQASTTDYNGLYRGKYVDFEAKETKNKTYFPLANIHDHQIDHMNSIINHGGICFTIIRFSTFDETFLLEGTTLLEYWENKKNGGKKSIPYLHFKENTFEIPFKYQARVDYLAIIDQLYF
jgi:recombination protein U